MRVINFKFTMGIMFILVCVISSNVSAGRKKGSMLSVGDQIRIESNIENAFNDFDYYGYFLGEKENILLVSSKWDIKIEEVNRINNGIVVFPFEGAKYDADSKTIYGKDNNGEFITIPLSEIVNITASVSAGDKFIKIEIEGQSIHNRLQFVSSYPDLLYSVPVSKIKNIEKWEKAKSWPPVFGFFVGGFVGYLYGDANAKDDPPRGWFDMSPRFSRETKITIDVILGSITGAAIGYLLKKDKWKEVSLKYLNISYQGVDDKGLNLSLTYNF